VRGIGKQSTARVVRPFVTLEDFVQRSGLEEGVLSTLAQAGAFEGFGVERRNAIWDIKGLSRTRYESLSLENRERSPHFDLLTDFEEVKWDYRTTSHSPRRHPLEPMRASLADQGLPDARTVSAMKNGVIFAMPGWLFAGNAPEPLVALSS
jgi:error-prone DNA polymerase